MHQATGNRIVCHLLEQLKAQRDKEQFMKQMGWAQFGMDALKTGGMAAAGALAGGMTTPTSSTSTGGTTGGSGSMTPYGARGGFNMPMVDFNAMSNNQQFDYWGKR